MTRTRSAMLRGIAWALALSAGTTACASGPLHGGVPLAVPAQPAPRPPLPVGADTNDARAYYARGAAWLNVQVGDSAAMAFYWATRLNPDWAEALYAYRIALHLENLERVPGYLSSEESFRSPGVRAIDSIGRAAYQRNPFVAPRFDGVLASALYFKFTGRHPIERVTDSPGGAMMLVVGGAYKEAADVYARLLKRAPNAYALHADRARALFLAGAYDSALTEMIALRDGIDKIEATHTVTFVSNKAYYEYAIGAIQLARGDMKEARAAYERALGADLSFYMAHVALADVSIRTGDTTNALREYDLAVQLRADDEPLRYRYGLALLEARQATKASEQLRRATQLDPDDCRSYLPLAYAAEYGGSDEEVIAASGRYIACAPRSARDQIAAAQRLNAAAKQRAAQPPP